MASEGNRKKRSEAKTAAYRATSNYRQKHYEQITISYRVEEKMRDKIKAHCEDHKDKYLSTNLSKEVISVSEFIKRAIETQMKIDKGDIIVIEK